MSNFMKYSQTCVQRPRMGPKNSGRCLQVVFVQRSFMLYNRGGQSAARGPHAALQTFFAALEFKGGFKYYIPHSKFS